MTVRDPVRPVSDRAREQLAIHAPCGTVLEFHTDAIGRVLERCPECDGRAWRMTNRPRFSAFATHNIPEAQLLPKVEPGQLRCQRCARGVEGRKRFCPPCQTLNRADAQYRRPVSAETRARLSAAIREARKHTVFRPKRCACGIEFQPTGPNSRFHAADCAARKLAKVANG